MAFPGWLKKLPAILKKVADIVILGRQAGLWNKKPQPFMRAISFADAPELQPAFSWLYAAHKGLKNAGLAILAVLAVHLQDPVQLAAFLGILPDTLEKMLIPFHVALAMLIKNWYDHRNDVVQFVVPVDDKMAPPVPMVVKPPENTQVLGRSDAGA